MEELAENNVSMFCLKITSFTDIMFGIFQNVYDKYESTILKIVNNNKFTEEVVNTCIDYYSTYRNYGDE